MHRLACLGIFTTFSWSFFFRPSLVACCTVYIEFDPSDRLSYHSCLHSLHRLSLPIWFVSIITCDIGNKDTQISHVSLCNVGIFCIHGGTAFKRTCFRITVKPFLEICGHSMWRTYTCMSSTLILLLWLRKSHIDSAAVIKAGTLSQTLKLERDDYNNWEKPKDEILVSNQYTLFVSLRFSLSDCGYSAVKTYANKREFSLLLLEESKTEVPRDVRNSKVRKQDKFRRDWSRH